ncbi:Tfp pilus assembly protein FimT/FimU [Massilia sp. H6]|uniref:pilus assembly FimT family protein n=1 Tax=Massilia sp. H6 TaxID=2970464 RepID=UPI0021698CFD|nr:prepilin-type N-terminal cleavage/methylation domain-containing protein [Massilia sp. H6]UVW27314.1 prepilin-type N-terminal cleavage/methylation domain-containing protein [Massilia sp. H6]
MHPISLPLPSRCVRSRAGNCAGFTLVEAMIALAVFAIVLAMGVPRMSDWLAATRAAAATQFYAEGLALARAQALAHNGASRLVLIENAISGQYDWRVDLCFPTPESPCNDEDGNWSTVSEPVRPAQASGAGVTSIVRSADALPDTARLAVSTGPDEATSVYFTPLGWVDTLAGTRMMRIDLAPAGEAAFPAASVVLTLAGVASRCDPAAPAGDARRCPA